MFRCPLLKQLLYSISTSATHSSEINYCGFLYTPHFNSVISNRFCIFYTHAYTVDDRILNVYISLVLITVCIISALQEEAIKISCAERQPPKNALKLNEIKLTMNPCQDAF